VVHDANSAAWAAVITIIAAAVAVAFTLRSRSRRLDARLRADWAKPLADCALTADEIEDIAVFRREVFNDGGGTSVDDTTWNDLNMDAIYRRMNRTHSSAGDESLYAMLRNLGADNETLARRGRWINALGSHDSERVKMQRRLIRVGKNRYHGANLFLSGKAFEQLRHGWAYYSLAIAPIILIALSFVNQRFLLGVAA
jgi:hypothetical protein